MPTIVDDYSYYKVRSVRAPYVSGQISAALLKYNRACVGAWFRRGHLFRLSICEVHQPQICIMPAAVSGDGPKLFSKTSIIARDVDKPREG